MIEIKKLNFEYVDKLLLFLNNNKSKYFIPHKYDKDTIIKNIKSKDKYYIIINNKNDIISYGMLRGYEEGYEIPSLGIIIDKKYRKRGLSILFMTFLEINAKLLNANSIRLTVIKNNKIAINLYKKRKYILNDYSNDKL